MSELGINQRRLTDTQLAEFYIDEFVAVQSRQFWKFTAGRLNPQKSVVDMGGGCGYFARAVHAETGSKTRVIDLDARALEQCRSLHGTSVEAVQGDAISPPHRGDEGVVCFNLILHHLVGDTAEKTRELQKRALLYWRDKAEYVFVNEYIYESPFGASGRLIYEITSSQVLSSLARQVSKVVPSLRANTFGVGVRFRANKEWLELFDECGYEVVENETGHDDEVAVARRLLLIKSISLDSFLLKPR